MKKAYIGIDTEIPIYETQNKTITVNTSNIGDVFEVANGNYYFKGSGSTFTTNNKGVVNSTATTTLTAKTDMSVSFTYSYSSEYNYDKLTIKVAGRTVADALSGVTEVRTYSGSLKTGQTIEFTYKKDSSQDANDDQCKFYNMSVNGNIKTQVGTETKCVARKIKKGYIGVPTFEKRALPSGYTQVEYIQSSDTQHIDTGFKPNQDTRVVMSVEFVPSTTNDCLFGAITSSASVRFGFSNYKTGKYRVHYYNKYTEVTSSVSYTEKFKLDMNKNIVTFNDGEYTCSTTYNSFQCEHSMWLFDINSSGTSAGKSIAKLYSCQIYDNGTLVRDFVPCKNSSGTIGLYDIVNGKFYKNAGTGTFTAGSDYQPVARKIKKAYIGIGGVARPCWSGGELAYYGAINKPPLYNSDDAATSLGNVAIYAQDNGYMAINSGLTWLSSTTSSWYNMSSGTPLGNYAIFGGGRSSNGSDEHYETVAVNESLTRTSPQGLHYSSYWYGAATVGNKALFYGQGDWVSVYSADLSRSTLQNSIYKKRTLVGATTIGDNAIFAGGYECANVEAISATLTCTKLADMSEAAHYGHGITFGDYAMFSFAWTTTVQVYNKDLTRQGTVSLSGECTGRMATVLGNYAMFDAVSDEYSSNNRAMNVFDKSLTKTLLYDNTEIGYWYDAVTVGNYAVFSRGTDAFAYTLT